jgi:methylated-DNA-[protein]-cysteine S-methyltransferase
LESKQVTYIKTPIDINKITGDKNGISSISVLDHDANYNFPEDIPTCVKEYINPFEAYFYGERKEFNLQLNTQGTNF